MARFENGPAVASNLNAIDDALMVEVALKRLGRGGSFCNYIDDRIANEMWQHPNTAAYVGLVTEMAVAGIEPYYEEIKQDAMWAFGRGMGLGLDIADSIALQYELDRERCRDDLLYYGASTPDIELTEDSSQDDARKALSETVLRRGEDGFESLNGQYQAFAVEIKDTLAVQTDTFRYFKAGFGLLLSEVLKSIDNQLNEKFQKVVDAEMSSIDSELAALFDSDM